jgi:hypothetical protein
MAAEVGKRGLRLIFMKETAGFYTPSTLNVKYNAT